MRRATQKILITVLAPLLLSGCLGDMPTSGPIGFGRQNSTAPQSNFVRTILSPPVPGADPAGIVRGFMAAAAGDSGTFSTARLFLAPEMREEWRPQREIRVVSDRGMSWEYDNLGSPGLVSFSGTQVATINAAGEYIKTEEPYTSAFRLRLVNQEWRISSLSDGVTLSESELGRSYRSVAIYYPNRSRTALVPNHLYLPVRPALATTMVQTLLRGPSPWLRPAVRSAFPSGTTLEVNAVPVVDGVATVDLSEEVARASSSDRIMMSAQLVHTLRQVTDITAIRITAGGVPLAVPGKTRIQSITSWQEYSPDAGTGDPRLYFLNAEGPASIATAVGSSPESLASDESGLRSPGISPGRDQWAALDSTGNLVLGDLRSDGAPPALAPTDVVFSGTGRNFLGPQWDISATFWVMSKGQGRIRAWAGRVGTTPVPVSAPDLRSGSVSAYAIARDGARVVVATTRLGSSSIFLMRIVATGSGEQQRYSFEEPRLLTTLYGSVSDLEWISGSQVLALGGRPGELRQIWNLALDDGGAVAVGPAVSALSIAAAPDHPIVIGTADQRLLILRDGIWTMLTTGRDPTFAG